MFIVPQIFWRQQIVNVNHRKTEQQLRTNFLAPAGNLMKSTQQMIKLILAVRQGLSFFFVADSRSTVSIRLMVILYSLNMLLIKLPREN